MVMTSAEASGKLRNLIKFYEVSLLDQEIPIVEVPLDRADILALQIAIESLDAYGLIERLSDIKSEPVTTSGKIRKDAMQIIRKRTRGKWIPQDEFSAFFKCSICGIVIDNDFPIWREFCPHCGSGMMKEGDPDEN